MVAAKGALNLCITQMQTVLSSQYLPRGASMEIMSRAYHATETYVQVCFLPLGGYKVNKQCTYILRFGSYIAFMLTQG